MSIIKHLLLYFIFFNANMGFARHLSDYHVPIFSENKLAIIQNQAIKMVVFTPYTEYHLTDKVLNTTIWATVSPDIKQRCSKYLNQPKYHLSHKQLAFWLARLLGLPDAHAEQRRIVEIEVPVIQAYYGKSPKLIGIFRPCADPRIGIHPDHSPICPKQMNQHDASLSRQFKAWFAHATLSAHKNSSSLWSGRGYTYNRNIDSRNPFGVSEFIVLKGTPVKILANPKDASTPYITPEQYCK